MGKSIVPGLSQKELFQLREIVMWAGVGNKKKMNQLMSGLPKEIRGHDIAMNLEAYANRNNKAALNRAVRMMVPGEPSPWLYLDKCC